MPDTSKPSVPFHHDPDGEFVRLENLPKAHGKPDKAKRRRLSRQIKAIALDVKKIV